MKRTRRTNWWPWVFALLLTAYTVFTLLDAFVIPRAVVRVAPSPTPLPTAAVTAPPEGTAPVPTPAPTTELTRSSYVSETVSIHLRTIVRFDTQVHLAEVELRDPTALKTAVPGGVFGRNINDSVRAMAEENGAVFAVNGDFYGYRDWGYVMRNGFLFREDPYPDEDNEDLVYYADGHLEIVRESEVTAAELAEAGAVHIFSFGPALLRDGEIQVREGQEVKWSFASNPRTALGVLGPGHLLFLVSDGRTEDSDGLSLLQLAEVLQEQGCELAYNLDGGGSSTMWFNGEVVNFPTYSGDYFERNVSDIIYIGKE